jgi:hypothetical protein
VSAQRICQQKVRNCLRQLRISSGHHGERTLGSETYLGICADYVDIFLFAKLSLYYRVVLAAKVLFFFRLWRLWLKHGDHTVGGNTKSLTQAKSFVSQQCFLDVQMSCHFVVLLIKMFRDFYLALEVPLHLTGSDSCEKIFSRIGGMQGMERAYNFHELINCANALNQLSAVDYGENGLQFGQAHNKQKNVWANLYLLQEGEDIANLADFSGLATDEDIFGALREGFKEAQALIRVLNMAPSTVAKHKKWFIELWVEEANDPKFGFTYKPSKELVVGEDGDAEVMRAALEIGVDLDEGDARHPASEGNIDDGVDPRVLFENEARDIISNVRSGVQCPNDGVGARTSVPMVLYCPTVSISGKVVYKSTLMNEHLNGNDHL